MNLNSTLRKGWVIMKKRSLVVASLLLTFILALGTSAFAASPDTSTKAPSPALDAKTQELIASTPDSAPSRIPAELQEAIDAGKKTTVVITDAAELKQIAHDQGMKEVPAKIEYDYTPLPQSNSNTFNPLVLSPAVTSGYWAKTQDYGSGWYDSSQVYNEFIIDGPDTFVYSESVKRTSTWNGSFGMNVSALSGQIGFSSGVERTVTFTSNTPVKANQQLDAKLFVTYHKVWYSVYNGPLYDDTQSICCGAGYALDPNGTYIQKTFTPPN